MKLLKQSVENIGHIKDYKGIERIARLCYRSEGKITENSYLKFVKMLFKNGHLSVLEHLNIILKIEIPFDDNIIKNIFDSNFIQISLINWDDKNNVYLVSGSLRAFYEHCIEYNYFSIFKRIVFHLGNFNEIYGNNEKWGYENNDFKIEIISEMDLIQNRIGINSKYLNSIIEKHIMHTFYVVCNRGISHEWVRHRWTHAITQASTRFIKFDNVEYILPLWFYNKKGLGYYLWKTGLWFDSLIYRWLLKLKFTPQQARDSLSHSLKTSLYSTMSLKQWKHFLKMRDSEKAHPLIRELAKKIKEILKSEYSCVFSDCS